MSNASVTNLSQLLAILRARLVVFREFQANTDDSYYRTALNFVIEDTQEAIARTASRLRQLGERTADRTSTKTLQIDLSDAREQEDLAYALIYVWRALKEQLDWYNTTVKTLLDDADTQAILVALAEQNRVRLERWENLMAEMKVSPRT